MPSRTSQAWALAGWLALLAGCAPSGDLQGAKRTEAVFAALDNAEEYVLFSLEPTEDEEAEAAGEVAEEAAPGDPSAGTKPAALDKFHGWRVLGQTTIDDKAVQKKLNGALDTGRRESDGSIASCFWPRHGIRVRHGGKEYDLVICFECAQVEVYEGGQRGGDWLTSHSPQAVLDEVLRSAGVPLAKHRQ